MRIILTDKGKETIEREFSELRSEEALLYSKITTSKFNQTKLSLRNSTTSNFNSTRYSPKKLMSYSTTKIPFSLSSSTTLRKKSTWRRRDNYLEEIQVKTKKLSIPSSILKVYNTQNENSKILPSIPDQIKKNIEHLTHVSYNELLCNTDNQTINSISLPIKDLLKTKAIKNLKFPKKIDILKLKVDENNFRTIYKNKKDKELLQENLDKSISVRNVNIIKYLNEKEKISEKFIDKLAHFKDESLNKTNKICQKMFKFEQNDVILKNIIKEKIIANKKINAAQGNYLTLELDDNLHQSAEIKKKYDNFKKDKDFVFHDDMLKIRSIWDKNKVQRLFESRKKVINSSLIDSDRTKMK